MPAEKKPTAKAGAASSRTKAPAKAASTPAPKKKPAQSKAKTAAAASGRARKAANPDKPLTEQEKVFADQYLIDLNARRAALVAKYSLSVASTWAYQWVSNPELKPKLWAYINAGMKARQERTQITADKVLKQLAEIAFADPSQLMTWRHVCCRYCFGIDHQYQWEDEREYRQECALEQARAREEKRAPQLPSDAGGYGFVRNLRPHPLCPRCLGEGHGEHVIADIDALPPEAKVLYAGLKVGKTGIEVQMHSQDKARELLMRHFGLLNDKMKLQGDEEHPLVALLAQMAPKRYGPVEEPAE